MRFNGVITKALVSVALCVGTAPAYANAACQAGQNCVLPITEPPPVVAEPVAVVEEGGGLGIWPILIGVAALALVAWLVLDDDDEPESP
jgi:hypothetical protein